MADISVAVGFLAFAFGFHIVLVNIDMGLGILIPLMKRYGETKNDEFLVKTAKRYMRYFAIMYASAGVFGTAFTVFLLTFFPSFLRLAGVVLLWPFGLAVLFLILRLFSISAYWYTWDRLDPEKHFYIGALLILTSLIVPLAFRSVFAFLNTPSGIVSLSPLKFSLIDYFLNPTLLPLYLKSITGALVVTFLTLASIHIYRISKNIGDAEKEKQLVGFYFTWAFYLLLIQVLFGLIYIITLWVYVPYKFNNIFGSYLWLLIIKILVVIFQIYIAGLIWNSLRKGVEPAFTGTLLKETLAVGPISLLGIVVGEYLNAFTHLPYFIAQPDLAKLLPEIDLTQSINKLALFFDLYAITIFAILPLLLAFLVLLYYVVSGRVTNNTS